jgi:hypothetical protein
MTYGQGNMIDNDDPDLKLTANEALIIANMDDCSPERFVKLSKRYSKDWPYDKCLMYIRIYRRFVPRGYASRELRTPEAIAEGIKEGRRFLESYDRSVEKYKDDDEYMGHKKAMIEVHREWFPELSPETKVEE